METYISFQEESSYKLLGNLLPGKMGAPVWRKLDALKIFLYLFNLLLSLSSLWHTSVVKYSFFLRSQGWYFMFFFHSRPKNITIAQQKFGKLSHNKIQANCMTRVHTRVTLMSWHLSVTISKKIDDAGLPNWEIWGGKKGGQGIRKKWYNN